MQVQSSSLLSQTWQRLKKNKLAIGGLVIIVLAFLVAIFGYTIAPDNSPNADLQTVEIQAKKPGYTQLFLKIPDKKNKHVTRLENFLFGYHSQFRYLPITGYSINGNIIFNYLFHKSKTYYTKTCEFKFRFNISN